MKLYATTTSERASKGQGGNKFITVEITANKQIIALIKVFPSPMGQTTQGYDSFIVQWLETTREGKETGTVIHGEIRGVKEVEQIKGKSQKGEWSTTHCIHCGSNQVDYNSYTTKYRCMDCGKTSK